MNPATQIEGQKLLIEFYQALDEARFEDAAKRFAATGEWHRKGEVLVGPDKVAAAYDGRDPNLRTRHVLTNVLIDEIEAGLRFSVYLTVYSGQADSDDTPVVPGPAMVLTSHGELTRSGNTLKIARKETVRQFLVRPAGK